MLVKSMFAPEGSKGVDTNCLACKLHGKCTTPNIPVAGKGKLGILIIGEAPTTNEDKKGEFLVGSSASFLRKKLSDRGLRLDDDFWYTTTITCKTPKGKEPTDKQLNLCRDKLLRTIDELNPAFIWTVGNVATKALLGHGLKKVSITSLCGRNIPLHDRDCWVTPMMPHSIAAQKERDKNVQSYYDRLLYRAIQFVKDDLPLPYVNPFENITYLHDAQDIVATIHKIIDSGVISSFDFETTGLYPWIPGHMTTSMGISTHDTTYAFPVEHPEAEFTDKEMDDIEDAIAAYIEAKHLTKVAHHANFDIRWTEWVMNTMPQGKFPCTMTGAHILDHRPGNLSLKDIAFINWGIVDYDKATDGYIRTVPGTDFNKMHKMPLKEQLMYVGADARLTLKTFDEQETRHTIGTEKANNFFNDMLPALRDISNNGIHVDVEWYDLKTKELTEKIEELDNLLTDNKDAERYYRIYKQEFSHGSGRDLQRMLFEMHKLTPVGVTGSGANSVDEKALVKIDFWMCPLILKIRKLLKLRDTYIKQYLRNEHNGVVHPDYRLDTARTMRSSCLDPNAHNTPKRNEESKRIIRTGWVPPPLMRMWELDYSGMEVSTSAMYHKDPTFIKYLVTPGTDMHRDQACNVWLLEQEDLVSDGFTEEEAGWAKKVRFFIKNMWTFPQFYGDYFGSCAPQLWETCIDNLDLKTGTGIRLIDNLEDHGITTLKQFTSHCEEQEHKLWDERFPVYTEWKKEVNDFYLRHGYVETYLGFVFNGLLDRKQTANYPIQGTAFHLLLWALWRINDISKRDKWVSYPISQVHDSVIGYSLPEEEPMLIETVKKVCTEEIVDEFPFINVPLGIEIEFSELGGNFAKLTEVKL